jgi:nucleoside 2-deoxyribosyltransferase
MKYYISYKFSGEDEEKLKEILSEISSIIESHNNETFVSYRDIGNWGEISMDSKEIITKALAELRNADCILCLVLSSEKSEGMLLEAGYAKALGKKIIVAKKDDVRIVFLKDIADDSIEFNTYEDLKEKLHIYFNKK